MTNIAIVTSSYNAAQFLPKCLESVRRQTQLRQQDCHIDHIIADGASHDTTESILRATPHIRWISEPDSGQAEGFNKGVVMAKDEWICWLNADDELAPGVFASFLKTLGMNPHADVIYGHTTFIDENSRPLWTSYHLPYRYSLIRNNVYVPPTSGTFFRRQLLIDRPLDASYHYVMDVEWFLRCGANLNAVLSDHIFSRFRISTQGKTSEMIKSGHVNQQHDEERERYRQKYIYSQWPNLSLEQARHQLVRRQRLYKIYYYWLKARYIPRYLADQFFKKPSKALLH